MDDSQEFPALRLRLAILANDLAGYTLASERDESGTATISERLTRIRAEYAELERALRRLEHKDDSRIGVTWHTLLAVASINGGFMALIIYLLFLQH